MRIAEQGGQPQEQPQQEVPLRSRRHFIQGALLSGVGFALMGGGATDWINTKIKRAEQSARAATEVEAEGTPRPDPNVLADAQNLRDEMRSDPLMEVSPDVKQQTRQVLQRQANFTKAQEQRVSEIRAKEGYGDGRVAFDEIAIGAGVMPIAGGTALLVGSAIEKFVFERKVQTNPQPTPDSSNTGK